MFCFVFVGTFVNTQPFMSQNVHNVNNKNFAPYKKQRRRKIFIKNKKPLPNSGFFTKAYELVDRLEIVIETEYVIVPMHSENENDKDGDRKVSRDAVSELECNHRKSTVHTDIN